MSKFKFCFGVLSFALLLLCIGCASGPKSKSVSTTHLEAGIYRSVVELDSPGLTVSFLTSAPHIAVSPGLHIEACIAFCRLPAYDNGVILDDEIVIELERLASMLDELPVMERGNYQTLEAVAGEHDLPQAFIAYMIDYYGMVINGDIVSNLHKLGTGVHYAYIFDIRHDQEGHGRVRVEGVLVNQKSTQQAIFQLNDTLDAEESVGSIQRRWVAALSTSWSDVQASITEYGADK